jgi:hypothetical protein
MVMKKETEISILLNILYGKRLVMNKNTQKVFKRLLNDEYPGIIIKRFSMHSPLKIGCEFIDVDFTVTSDVIKFYLNSKA